MKEKQTETVNQCLRDLPRSDEDEWETDLMDSPQT